MKNNETKLLSLALVAVLVFTLFAGCSSQSAQQNGMPNSTQSSNGQTDSEHPDTGTPTEPAPEVDRTAEEIYKNHPELTPVNYDSPALLPKSEDAGQEYIDNLTFICDSPTYWLKGWGMLKDGTETKQIWTGPEGTMTLAYLRDYQIVDPYDGALRTIPETAALRKPPYIVIAVGVNGISFMDEEYFTQEYEHLIDVLQEASPDSVILLQSIYPIYPTYKHWGSITNASITAGNSWILKIAEKYGLHYVDAFSALVGEDGNIQEDLIRSDGLHPNEAGLTKVLEYHRTHAYIPKDK